MRHAFSDPRHEAAFTLDGYVLVDLLDGGEVDRLLRAYEPFAALHEDEFTTSVLSDDAAARRRIHEELSAVLAPRLAALLADYRIAVASYAVKQADSEASSVGLHQDFAFVDERRARGISFWCPLVAVDEENGYLGVARGSHVLNSNLREPCPLPYPELLELIEEECMTYLPMRPGQALLMDNRLFHGSPSNRSDRARVVAAGIAVPCESALLYCHRDLAGDDTVLEVYEVPADYYLRAEIGGRPSEGSLVATVPRQVAELSPERLRSLCSTTGAAGTATVPALPGIPATGDRPLGAALSEA